VEIENGYGQIDYIVAKLVICDLIYHLAINHKDKLCSEMKDACEALGRTYPEKEIEAAVPYLVELIRQIDISDILYDMGKIKLSRIRYIKNDLKKGTFHIDRRWDKEDDLIEEDHLQ
jgi:hypothetical protein